MIDGAQIKKILERTMARVNAEVVPISTKDPLSIVLYGAPGAILDSLNLVNFIFILEEEILAVANLEMRFSMEDVLSESINPFSNLNELSLHLQRKLQQESLPL